MPKKNTESKAKSIGKRKSAKKVKNAFVVSQYYGFEKLKIDEIDKVIHQKTEKMKHGDLNAYEDLPKIEDCTEILFHCYGDKCKNKVLPYLFYTEGEFKNPNDKNQKRISKKSIGLHIIGTPKSIAEAILIKTAYAILQEEGFKDLTVEINSLGGKESMAQFTKALNAYLRPKAGEMDPECRELLKCGGHALVSCAPKKLGDILNESPASVEFLSEANRNHFMEVIEYLESQDIPYEINKNILGNPHYSTHTVFSLIDKKTGKILATGTRYNNLSNRTVKRKGHPGVSINIKTPKMKEVAASKKPDFKKSDIYFIQLGYGAKLKSLEVIELLRKSDILVHHSIGRDKMTTQTEFAQKKKAKYILLMGQKEANEDTIVVRDIESNSQTAIPLDNLVNYLTKLKKKKKK
jgi:histidyl-tRNA synthetase